MGIIKTLLSAFDNMRERHQAKGELRARVEALSPVFLEETKPLCPANVKNQLAALYRMAWMRAVVLERIYTESNLPKEAEVHKALQTIAARMFFRASRTGRRRATLRAAESTLAKLHKVERSRVFPQEASMRPLRVDEGKAKPRKTKRATGSPTRPSPAQTRSKYVPRRDGTAIDNFVVHLEDYLGDDAITFSVSGLTSQPRRLSPNRKWIEVSGADQKVAGGGKWVKTYKVGLLIPPNRWRLYALVQRAKSVEQYSTGDYVDVYLKPIADQVYHRIHGCVVRHDKNFSVSAGVKASGKVSAWVTLTLPVTPHDIIMHCGSYLTDYPKQYVKELATIVEQRLARDPQQMVRLYRDTDFRYTFLREVEQELRKTHNVPLIGEGNLSEISLYRLLKTHFPDAKHEYGPAWLGRQRFDIYLPSRNIAIEYNGPQHYEPLELFGGAKGLMKTQRRDKLKRRLAEEHGVVMFVWPYTRVVNEHEVSLFLKEVQLTHEGEPIIRGMTGDANTT